MKGSEFVFHYGHLLYYRCQKINMNRINKKDKCFQHAVAVALNHEEIGKYAERTTKVKPFIKKFKWEGINFP